MYGVFVFCFCRAQKKIKCPKKQNGRRKQNSRFALLFFFAGGDFSEKNGKRTEKYPKKQMFFSQNKGILDVFGRFALVKNLFFWYHIRKHRKQNCGEKASLRQQKDLE